MGRIRTMKWMKPARCMLLASAAVMAVCGGAVGQSAPLNSSGLPLSGGTLTGSLTAPQVNLGNLSIVGGGSSLQTALSGYATLSGTVTSGVHYGPYQFTIPNDNLAYSGANYVNGLYVQYNFGGPQMTGSRNGLFVNLSQTAGTANTGNATQYYVGLVGTVGCNYNDSGTSGFANAAGQCVGENIIANLSGTATYYYTLNASEMDTDAAAGTSVAHKFGLLNVLSGADAVRGTYDDAAMAFVEGSSSSLGWKYLFQVGKTDSMYPATAADTTLLGCVTDVQTSLTRCKANYGMDLLTNWTWTTGGFPFRSPGFSVDYLGNVITNALSITGAVVANGITAQGQVTGFTNFLYSGNYIVPATLMMTAPAGSGQTATASVSQYAYAAPIVPTGTGGTAGGSGYIANDILTCGPVGVRVVTPGTSGSLIGSALTANGGYTSSTFPTNPATCSGGTGSGAILNIAYSVSALTIINPGGPYSAAPTVTFSTGYVGNTAHATAIISNGLLLSAGVTTLNGHLASTQTTSPTVACTTAGTCSLSATATDVKGTVTEGTGSAGFVLTFAGSTSAFASAPDCTISPDNGVVPSSVSVSVTALTVVNALATGDKFTYHCIQ